MEVKCWRQMPNCLTKSVILRNRGQKFIMARQEHVTQVEEVAIRVRVERLKNHRYLGTSPDVPGLVAESRSVAETVEIAQGLARKIVESCLEHGDPLPAVFAK